MFTDTRTLADNETITADICIIGAGPAGTTLAREFLDSDLQVVLLESGGQSADSRIQRLSEGTLSGAADEPVDQTHLRQLGGTANHWIIKMSDKQFGYRYAPLNDIDFRQRDAIPNSGWPVSRADLDPYYSRAHEVGQIGPYQYAPGNWETEKFKPLRLDKERVVSDFFTFGPTLLFGRDFPRQFQQSGNIHVYIHATVVELLSSEHGETIEAALVRGFDGKQTLFKARQFIIACGGFQTPRLLLASQSRSAAGIGNQFDLVGRYYMDHSLVPSGNFFPHDPRIINSLGLYDMRLMEGCSVMAKLSLAETVMQKEGLRNFAATFFPMPELRDVKAVQSLKNIAIDLQSRKFPANFGDHLLHLYKGKWHLIRMLYQKTRYGGTMMPGFGQGGWSRFDDNEKKYRRLELMAFVEQSPNPNNRVTLIDEKDELGCPKINVHYQWDQNDLDSIRRAQEIMREELLATGLGSFEPASKDGAAVISALGLHHLMGTTRMSDDPKRGVVDEHCQVHGVNNLSIASSSVFVTSGYANPTLTIMALAIRLADRLKSRLIGQ